MSAKLRFWIEEILECNRRDHTTALTGPGDQRGPFRSARALAMAMMAMHDAHAAIAGGAPYRTPPAPPSPADAAAAAAAAAYAVLQALYPRQIGFLAHRWQEFLARHGGAPASVAFGQRVGLGYLVWRGTGGTNDDARFAPGPVPMPALYEHGRDPFSPDQGFAGAGWGDAEAFLTGLARQHLDPPAGRSGPHTLVPNAFYAAEFEEVVKNGALRTAGRSAKEEETGIFWAYDGAEEIGTPPRLYIQVVLSVLDGRPALSPQKLLEVVSACAVAMGDAGIQAWHYKYSNEHMLWRPVLGIRKAEARPETPADPLWVPLGKPETNTRRVGTTPDFPAYPSGHATFGAACFDTLRRFLRKQEHLNFTDDEIDPIGFTFTSDEFNGRNTDPRDGLPRRVVTRTHDSLWQAIVDNAESRIFLGVHWRMDGLSKRNPTTQVTEHGRPAKPGEVGRMGGVFLGLQIAREVARARGFL